MCPREGDNNNDSKSQDNILSDGRGVVSVKSSFLCRLAKALAGPANSLSSKIIDGILGDLAQLTFSERIYVTCINSDKVTFSAIYEWVHADSPLLAPKFQNLPLDEFQFWKKIIKSKEIFQVSDLENIPDSYTRDKKLLKSSHVKSFLAVPIITEDLPTGFLVFFGQKEGMHWPEEDYEFLEATAIMIGSLTTKALESNPDKFLPFDIQADEDKNQKFNRELTGYASLMSRVFSGLEYGFAFFDISSDEYIYINPRFSELFGFSSIKQFRKEEVFDIFHRNGYDISDFFSEATSGYQKDFSLSLGVRLLMGYMNPVENTRIVVITIMDISPLADAEKDEKDFNRQLRILSEAAIKLIALQKENLFDYIGDTAWSLLENSIVLVNSYDPKDQTLQTRYVKGFGSHIDMVSRLLGRHPLHKKYPLNEKGKIYSNLISSPVINVEGGLAELSLNTIPEPVAKQIEKITGTTRYFTCGLYAEGNLYGTLVLMLRNDTTVRPVVLETLSRMASSALHTHALSSELEKTTSILSHTNRIAKLGYWQFDFLKRKLTISKDLVCEIFQDKFVEQDVVIPVEVFLRKYADPGDVTLLSEKLESIIQNAENEGYAEEFEWKLRVNDSETIIIYSRGVVQKEGWVLGIAKDITADKLKQEREKQMEISHQTSMAKQMFLDNMSHEMRTPLNGIIGMSELLMHAGLNDHQRELLSVIKESSDSLLELISSIHELSRIEAEKIVIQNKLFNPAEMLQKTIGIFKAAAHEKEISLELKIHAIDDLCLIGDAFRLQQILTNLLANALKFTPRMGDVLLESRITNTEMGKMELFVSVKDTGIGIPQEKIPILFERFTQADGSLTRMYEGLGIGLSISRELIELMGGQIGVSSIEGKGSEFWIKVELEKC